MYFIYKSKNILRNIITFVLIICDVFLIYSVSQIVTDKNNSPVISVYTQETIENKVTEDCLNYCYNDTRVLIGGDNICFIPMNKGILVSTVDDESIIKIGDYIVEINDIEIETENHLLKLIEESEGKEIKLKINRNNEIIYETISYKEIVSIRLGIKQTSGNAVITFYDEDTNQFASTGHSAHFFDDKDAKVTTFAYDYIDKSTDNYIGSLYGDPTDVFIGQTTKNLDTGVYGTITDESMLIDNPKFELGTKNEVKKGIAMIYCDIDSQGKQWYEVEVVEKDAYKSEKYFEMKMCDEEFIEKAGGVISGMSGTPIVQNGKIIGAISRTDRKDPTVFYGIYIDYMVKDLYNTK